MDLRNLDLKVEPMSFDGVILSNVLDVVPKDISTTVIDDLERVLKPGGTFFLCNESDGDHAQDEKWTEKIDGMTIYKDVQLKNILEQAGFRNIQIHKSEKGWLCITAQK